MGIRQNPHTAGLTIKVDYEVDNSGDFASVPNGKSFANLSDGKIYNKDNSGNVNPNNFIFWKLISDITPPTPATGLSFSGILNTGFTVSWTSATDNVAITGYDVFVNGVQKNGSTVTANSFQVTGLTAGTTYGVIIRAKDAAGNFTDTAVSNVTTLSVDTTPPVAPTVLQATNILQSSFVLSWSGQSDNVGVTAFDILLNNNVVAQNVSASPFTLTGLLANTSYAVKVRAKDAAGNSTDSAALTVTTDVTQSSGVLALAAQNMLNQFVQGDEEKLVDEQGLYPAGSPSDAAGKWNPNVSNMGNFWAYPARAIIDLKTQYSLTKLSFYDTTGSGNVLFQYLDSNNAWQTFHTAGMAGFNVWTDVTISLTNVRYIGVYISANNIPVPVEVVLTGTRTGTPPSPTPTPRADRFLPAGDYVVGNNIQPDEAEGVTDAYAHNRYFEGIGYRNSKGAGQLSLYDVAFSGNIDNILTEAKKAGKTSWLCLLGGAFSGGATTFWLNGKNSPESRWQSPDFVADMNAPASYATFVKEFAEAYVKRYGNNPNFALTREVLRMDVGQPLLAGLNLMNYIEITNEPDARFRSGGSDKDLQYTPQAFFALMSACYDADQNRLAGSGIVGIKGIDPNMKVVMGGLAYADQAIKWLKMMKFYADLYRGGSLPFDVVAIHHYSNTAGTQGGNWTSGLHPESSTARTVQIMTDTIAWLKIYMPNVEVFWDETGYDTQQASIQRAVQGSVFNAQQRQGLWNIRSVLIGLKLGYDRISLFTSRSGNDASGTLFESSGLTYHTDNGTQFNIPNFKQGWYYAYTFKNRLTGMVFSAEISSGNASVWIYKFVHNSISGLVCYVVWCPVGDESFVNNYVLNVQASETNVKQVVLTDSSIEGTETNLTRSGNTVTISQVNESPKFIICDNQASGNTLPRYYKVRQKVTLVSGSLADESGGNAANLTDEQNLVGDPNSRGLKQNASTFYNTGSACYYDLGSVKRVSDLFLQGGNDSGQSRISVGSPGNWTILGVVSHSFQAWSRFQIELDSRYVRIERLSGSIGNASIYVRA